MATDVPNYREALEAEEFERLHPRAAKSAESRGRDDQRVSYDPLRTEYQRDRDRVLHCKAFRRLAHKTQVFLAPEGDHYRTRLTHTLEVAQISRTIARALGLNEDLTEAIALAHDLGHTPFGHTGESALADVLALVAGDHPGAPSTYEHNLQSVRVIEHLEHGGKGLKLTWEVRDGVLGHTGGHVPATLEGQIVRTADRIAYVTHDIDDALRAGVIVESELPASTAQVLGTANPERITTMVTSMIAASQDRESIRLDTAVEDAMLELRSFLFENVYESPRAKAEEPKAYRVVQMLFLYYLEHLDELPVEMRPRSDEEPVQRVVDYVAGMTDRFAIREFERIFIPQKWMV